MFTGGVRMIGESVKQVNVGVAEHAQCWRFSLKHSARAGNGVTLGCLLHFADGCTAAAYLLPPKQKQELLLIYHSAVFICVLLGLVSHKDLKKFTNCYLLALNV